MKDAKIRTKKLADGTYAWTITGAGEWFPTQAVTATGARYQGNRFKAGMIRFETNSRRSTYLDWRQN